MRTLFICTLMLFLTLSTSAQNQDWQPIRTDDTYFYFGNDEYRAYRIDSVEEYLDSTIMYSFHELFAFDYSDCFNPYGPSWIGKKIKTFTDSTIIYNYYNEPITLLRNTEIGTKWNLYSYSETKFIEAEIISKTFENIGFTEDSIVTIEITSSDELSGSQIKISKNYGMIQGFNFLLFPELNSEFQRLGIFKLTGTTSKKESNANLTAFDIYNFKIGDEFHTHKYYVTWPEGDVHSNVKVIKKVVSKHYNSDSSEVTYTFDQCDKNGESNIQQTYLLNSEFINQLPFKPIWLESPIKSSEEKDFVFCQIGNQYNDFRFKDFGGHYIYENDSCYSFVWVDKKKNMTMELPYVMHDRVYFEKLGGPYYNYVFMFSENYYKLVYYKRGDTEWGVPYNCEDLVSVTERVENYISIYPNPAGDFITIETNLFGKQTTIVIFDILGQQIFESTILSNKEYISITALPNSLLFYQIKQGIKTVKSGTIIKE